MALTTGVVQKMTWVASVVCVWVEASPSTAELLLITFNSADTDAELDFKRTSVNLLLKAQIAGYTVTAVHPDDSAVISSLSFAEFEICPVGQAIHNDFYSVTGTDIPADAELVFESAAVTVTVVPDFVRPQWAFVAQLPSSIPAGMNSVRLQSASWTSAAVPIEVTAAPPTTTRVLYTGQPKSRPYSIVFVANPAILTEASSSIADTVFNSRPTFHSVVGYCLRMLLTITEDLWRQGNQDAQLRFTTIFDASQGVSDPNTLAHEVNPNIMEPRRDKLNGFVSRYDAAADLVFVMHGSTTHNRASAWFTSDAPGAGTSFTYDGVTHTHGHFAQIPGSAALPLDMDQTGITPLHECGHAVSDFINGMVIDLYVDGAPGGQLVINKKWRARSTDSIPASFANVDGTAYASDPNRDGLGYPAGWTSYHPLPVDATRPNVMDNYWFTFDDPHRCRFDQLTHAWITSRLRAKLAR